jgi:hypothetical protein
MENYLMINSRITSIYVRCAVLVTVVLCVSNGTLCFAEPAVSITDTDGKTFISGPFIKQFALGDVGGNRNDPHNYGHHTSYGVADPEDANRGIFTRKMWDESAYGAQGALIARKLLAFGTEDDVRLVRESLLTASIDPDGFVDASQSKRWHLGQQAATLESNAEYVLMAWAYLVHTADTTLFRAPVSRILCTKDTQNTWHSVVHIDPSTFDCGRPFRQDRNSPADYHHINSTVYFESIRASNWYSPDRKYFDNPGRILGQLVEIRSPFKSIRLPLAMRYPGNVKEFWRFQIYVVNNDTRQTVVDHIFESSIFPFEESTTWLEIELPVIQPAGHYNIEIHPVREDSRQDQIDSHWKSISWLNDVGPHVTGGATTKLYRDDPFSASQTWTLTSKVEQAFNWTLRRSLRNSGTVGIFINPFKLLRGTGEPGVSTSSYYDLFKSGYKDSYSILRYIESLAAYADLQHAGVARAQINATNISEVKTDFYQQMVNPVSGLVTSWIGCSSYAGEDVPLCDPRKVTDFAIQHPYNIEFLPSQALAVRLLNDQGQYPMIESRLASLRTSSRVLAGEFRTNARPVDEVTAGIWAASDDWNEKVGDYPDGRFWARYDVNGKRDFSQQGDWHLFTNRKGNGDFGNQEENGGVLLSTTAFIFEAGPYSEIYADWKTFVTKMNLIAAWIKQGSGDTGGFSEYLRKSIEDPFVKLLCQRARRLVPRDATAPEADTPTDGFGGQWCDYYKSVSYNLPENGAVAHSFVLGLLNLKLWTQGRATMYGQSFAFNNRNNEGQFVSQNIPMTHKQIASWPPEVKSVTVSGFRFNGKKVTLTCDRAAAGLICIEI